MCSERKFPAIHDDGSFTVVATFVVDMEQQPLSSELTEWIKEWVKRNNPWVRKWSNGQTETLDFFQDFKSLPIVVHCDQSEVAIRFEGRPGFKWWKDWFGIKFCRQLIDEIPGIQSLEHCRDAT